MRRVYVRGRVTNAWAGN